VSVRLTEKKRVFRLCVFRLFAEGKTPEQVLEELEDAPGSPAAGGVSQPQMEILFEEYIAMPIGEKLRLTLMTECVANRLHRLMDDISDLTRVDALLQGGAEKTITSLLDIKRKIKERMSKEFSPGAQERSGSASDEIDNEIDEYYERIFGDRQAQAQMR
jgi:hypothetical protein